MNDILQWGITTIVGILGILAGRFWERHDRRIKKDTQVFDNIKDIWSNRNTIEYMRHQDFGDTFSINVFRVMRDFMSYCETPDSYFLDNTLEKLRVDLINKTNHFFTRLAAESFPVPGIEANRIPPPEEIENIEEYRKLELELNSLANELMNAYDKLIRTGRKRL